jgi:hypothetical protein
MDLFVSRKQDVLEEIRAPELEPGLKGTCRVSEEEESTDFKLAILASLHPNCDKETLLEALLWSDGLVQQASDSLKQKYTPSSRKIPATFSIGRQSSLSSYAVAPTENDKPVKKSLTKKGRIVHLYRSEDIEAYAPCSIIHDFLPQEQANSLLQELLEETATYPRTTFQLFNKVVANKHTFCIYVDSWDEVKRQKNEYVYDGKKAEVCLVIPSHAACPMFQKCTQIYLDSCVLVTHYRTSAAVSPKCAKPPPKSKRL